MSEKSPPIPSGPGDKPLWLNYTIGNASWSLRGLCVFISYYASV